MADVSSSITSWSASEGSNSPAGTTQLGSGLDENLRMLQAVVVQATSHKGSDIASATTTDLGAVSGLMHDITGTTTITGFGTVRSGIWKILKYEGALILTHNATSLILLSRTNRTTAVGDTQIVISEGSGNWREIAYFPVGWSLVPTGAMLDFAGDTAPQGFLGCDGSAVSRTTYANLFAVIGETWGAGDASTTFNLPDFRRRVAVGSGGTGTSELDDLVGSTGGSETHTLSASEIPAHTHTVNTTESGTSGSDGRVLESTAASGANSTVTSNSNAGGGSAHNNIQPSAVVLKIIKI